MTKQAVTMQLAVVLAGASPAVVGAQPTPAAKGLSERDSAALVTWTRARAEAFVGDWRAIWTASFPPTRYALLPSDRAQRDSMHRRRDDRAGELRLAQRPERLQRPSPQWDRAMSTPYQRCMRVVYPKHHLGALSPIATREASATSARDYCPGWSFYGLAYPDMRRAVDSSLPVALIPRARERRAALLRQLDSARRQLPGDAWIVGQQARFLTEQGEFGGARRLAGECGAAAWWCGMLDGFTAAAAEAHVDAARAFSMLSATLDMQSRCAWEDIGLLLPADDARAWAALPCPDRVDVIERFWWLADPLWSDSINERRTEHYRRRVDVMLRKGLSRDEFFWWTPERGSDAAERVLLRYGMPSAMSGGDFFRGVNDGMLKRAGSPPSGPYVMPQYHRSRASVVPSWRAVQDPFSAASDAWDLHEPDTLEAKDVGRDFAAWSRQHGFRRLELSYDEMNLVWPHSVVWWPAEHFEPRRPIAQLPDPQLALLRRGHGVHIAAALDAIDPTTLSDATYGYPPRPAIENDVMVRASLLLSRGPDSTSLAAFARVPEAGRVVLRTDRATSGAAPAPVMVGVEVRTDGPGGGDARTRFAQRLPAPLSAMLAGALDISDPVLLHADSIPAVRAESGSDAVSTLLGAMRASTVVSRGSPLGIYWEVYGAMPSDSLDIAVRVARIDVPGRVQRVATALGISDDPRSSVAIGWREPRADHPRIAVPSDGVPIVARHIALDLSRLEPGAYRVDVEASRPGGVPARGSRSIRIR